MGKRRANGGFLIDEPLESTGAMTSLKQNGKRSERK
ncbi:hypothetical protein A943_19275 [Bacillus sp. CPSM8]|nr:hypothetical protein A943_19275 [Bacillus sp. CPSM8]KUL14878.1 hypothetical protein LI7559_00195 [Bacillus licheniformis LMG 7559]KUL19230.1 hypothetical protein LI6934_02795 [Bacillus licheniformis LMG 6934]